jgi:hypothetical protein
MRLGRPRRSAALLLLAVVPWVIANTAAIAQGTPKSPPADRPAAPSKDRGKIELPGTRAPGVDSADIVIIPMRGSFGYDGGNEWIDAEAFAAMLRQAKTLKPRFIVLDIESPGGRVSVMNLVADAILHELPKGAGPTIVAWPGMAGSAASFITLTCPRIIVKPTARIGAALTVVPTPKGMVAVEDLPPTSDSYSAKIRSFNEAFERLAIQYGGHPPEVREAMAKRTASLYWSPSMRKFAGSLPDPKKPGDFERVDDPDNVLTLTAPEALRFGIASGEAMDEKSLVPALGAAPNAQIVRLGAELPAWFQEVHEEVENVAKACDLETITNLVKVYANGLANAVGADRDLNSATQALKATRGDPRAADGIRERIRQATRRKSEARAAAGQAKVSLEKLEESAEKSLARLRELGAAVDLAPIAVSQVPQLRHSFDQYESGNLQGARESLR